PATCNVRFHQDLLRGRHLPLHRRSYSAHMPGGRCGRAAGGPVRVIVLTALGLVFLATAAGFHATAAQPAATADRLSLPQPVRNVDPLTGAVFKFRSDRLKTSSVPGPTADREDVRIAVGPSGAP